MSPLQNPPTTLSIFFSILRNLGFAMTLKFKLLKELFYMLTFNNWDSLLILCVQYDMIILILYNIYSRSKFSNYKKWSIIMSLINDGKETLKKAKIFEWIKREIDKISLTLYLFQQ